MKDVNSVTLVCRLTADPELRSLPSGTSVCNMRVAWSTSRKGAGGEWEDKPNYGDVVVWGNQAEACAKYLAKGRQIAVLGRLEWREWETKEGGKRQSLDIQAEQVQFIGGDGQQGGGQSRSDVPSDTGFAPRADAPPPRAPVDDDIPF